MCLGHRRINHLDADNKVLDVPILLANPKLVQDKIIRQDNNQNKNQRYLMKKVEAL